jgi:hypothetical protein
MDRRELVWRGRAAARTALDRAAHRARRPRWDRSHLLRAVARDAAYAPIREALARGRWLDAHRAIVGAVTGGSRRFPVSPAARGALARRITSMFPAAPARAAVQADGILDGRYDLLGYEGLRFDAGAARGSIDWHLDPVSGRRAPSTFWADVPYLSPAVGDHKVIWELNRHQHWLVLGRAFWLTGDVRYRNEVLTQLRSWLDANPPLTGINWASMLELGFRSISWLWALHLFAAGSDPNSAAVGSDPNAGEAWSVDLLLGIDRQLAHVEQHLSHYFSPNTHLLGEALALYVAGQALPMLRASARRAAIGRDVLLHEIGRQIAADGGHCERSTHYHRYTLDFYLLALVVAQLSHDPARTQFQLAVEHLARAARMLADDSGCMPHVGDDDGGAAFRIAGRPLDDIRDSLDAAAILTARPELGIAGPTEEAMWLLADERWAPAFDARVRSTTAAAAEASASSALRSGRLADTGYCVSRSAGGQHLVFDAGRHGYLNGGHAHADALSLTLTLGGAPLLIDPGTYCYTIDIDARDRMRSSALHNTLTLDHGSSSLGAGPFHWRRAADARLHRWRTDRRFDYIDASHAGYPELEHRRRVLAMHDDLLIVADRVGGADTHRADVHWHLHPSWDVRLSARGAIAVRGEQAITIAAAGGAIEMFQADAAAGLGWHSPVYGRLEPATTLRITRTANAPFWMATVFGLDPRNQVLGIEWLPVWAPAGALDHSAALRITRDRSVDCVALAERRDAADSHTWRAATVDTDAAMLFWRVPADGDPADAIVAFVDGSFAHGSGRMPFSIETPPAAGPQPPLRVAAISRALHEADADEERGPHVRDRRVR